VFYKHYAPAGRGTTRDCDASHDKFVLALFDADEIVSQFSWSISIVRSEIRKFQNNNCTC